MSGTEWLLLVVVVIGLPLLVAVIVTLWTLEMARQRNKKNRPQPAIPVKRNATRVSTGDSRTRVVNEVDRGSEAESSLDSDSGNSGNSGSGSNE